MSFSGYKSGPSRGRGYVPRGSRGGSSSWGGGRGRGQQDYSPSRSSHRGSWHRETPSYDRSAGVTRYADDERGYSRSSRDETFRRYSQESQGYSGMEVSHRSPELPRKRMRVEHGYHQASSSHHRSSDTGYEYTARYTSYEEKPYYREERKSYREHSESRYAPREDYRKEHKDVLDMPPPPPPSLTSRQTGSPRRTTYRGSRGGLERGRGLRSRGSIRGSPRGSRATFRKPLDRVSLRRKSMADTSYIMKKKMFTSRTSLDHLRKLRMQKLRRLKDDTDIMGNGEEPEPRKEENWDEELEERAKSSERAEVGIKDEPVVTPKVEKIVVAEAIEEADGGSVQITIQQNADGRAVNEDSPPSKSPVLGGHRFIRLQCPHCYDRCITFKQYTAHLYSTKHRFAMSKLMMRQKQSVLRLRQQQRKLQREEEERDTDTLAKFSSFCPVCKLNYRQSRATHSASKMHMEMKKLLFPYCKVCGIAFKATLLYDKHICSLDHIRREAYLEERLKQMEGRDRDGDDKEMNLDDFMIVDSVGDVDDAEELDDDEKREEKEEPDVLVGLEFVKTVEALYCDLCQRYLPRLDDPERAQSVHCHSSQHLRLYWEQQRTARAQDKKLEQHAKEDVKEEPKIHDLKKEPERVDDDSSKVVECDEPEIEKKSIVSEVDHHTDEQVAEEKLWADVDKDLGELLSHVGPEEEEESGAKSSDDDESVAESGRYDRFRYTKTAGEKQEIKPPKVDKIPSETIADVKN